MNLKTPSKKVEAGCKKTSLQSRRWSPLSTPVTSSILTWTSTCDLLPRVQGQLGRLLQAEYFHEMPLPQPTMMAPWWSRMARQQQAAEWRLAPAWSPPEEARGCTWLGNSHQKPGSLSCRSQLHPQVLRSRVNPRQTPGVPADEAQTRPEAGAANRPRSCPEWTHLMPVYAATGWDYRVLDCWPCLIFHLSFLFYLGL